MNQFLFYKNIIPLDRVKHATWYLKQPIAYDFAQASTFVPIMLSEVAEVAQELPIVLVPLDTNNYLLVAIMGLDQQQNLMIRDGVWTGRYVPAFLRRYPFITIPKPNDAKEFLVAMDAQANCLSATAPKRTTKGAQILFDGDKPSAWLMELLPFLERCHTDSLQTLTFTKKLNDLGLLTQANLSVKDASGGTHQISGSYLINQVALKKLSAEHVMSLFTNAWLEKIYQIQFSIRNFPLLPERLNQLRKIVAIRKNPVAKVPKKEVAASTKKVATKKTVKKSG